MVTLARPDDLRGSVPNAPHRTRTIPVFALGMALSLFLTISFVLCVVGFHLMPRLFTFHAAIAVILPEFTSLTWASLVLGMLQSFAWGWYAALVFGPLYNFFAARIA